MQVHLVDGTYELYRAYFGAPPRTGEHGQPVGAVLGFARSLLSLLQQPDTTHVACAFDRVIESFRNDLFAGYKTGDGIPADLWAQFRPAERIASALGVVVWPMIEFEADDALATAASDLMGDPGVDRVIICSPDKDLAQCVVDDRVVCLDRKRNRWLDADGVREKFGVAPASIPDLLALVGDAADGVPGVPHWGLRSAAAVLARYHTLDRIPAEADDWDISVRGATRLAESLRAHRPEVLLYRTLTTLRRDVPLHATVDGLRWRGASRAKLQSMGEWLTATDLASRVVLWNDE